MQNWITALLIGSALSFGVAGTAYAQDTTQTDQSEEDWRKSQKKSDTSDIIEGIINNTTGGWGNPLPPLSPVEQLPEESRRHVMKERARVMAETNPGEPMDTTYNPSEAAKGDPDLMEQEKEAWDVIMTDLEGGSGQGSGQPGDGPNKVAVAGRGGGQGQPSDPSVMRGGSSASVADILAQIKGLKGTGGGGSGQPGGQQTGQGQMPTGPLGQGGPSTTGQDQGNGTAPQGQSAQQGASTQSGQVGDGPSRSESSQPGQSQNPSSPNAPEGARGGSSSSVADILSQIKDLGAGAPSGSQSGQAPTGDNPAGQSSDGQSQNNGASSSPSDGQSGSDGDSKDNGDAQSQATAQGDAAQSAAQGESTQAADQASQNSVSEISPLERVQSDGPTGDNSGSQSSASDYLKRRDPN